MYQVHKFMGLNYIQNKYFIDQHVVAAQSLGISAADAEIIGSRLYGVFAVRCAAPTSVVKPQGPQRQSTCLTSDCPVAENAECDLYGPVAQPSPAVTSTAATAERSNKEEYSQEEWQHWEL
jgi:hypothetical protein